MKDWVISNDSNRKKLEKEVANIKFWESYRPLTSSSKNK